MRSVADLPQGKKTYIICTSVLSDQSALFPILPAQAAAGGFAVGGGRHTGIVAGV